MSQNNEQKKDNGSSPVAVWIVCFVIGYVLYAVLIG